MSVVVRIYTYMDILDLIPPAPIKCNLARKKSCTAQSGNMITLVIDFPERPNQGGGLPEKDPVLSFFTELSHIDCIP